MLRAQEERYLAKAKAKAAVKRKPAKAPARAPVVRAAKAQKKPAAVKVATPSARKVAKSAAMKASAAATDLGKKAPAAPAPRKTEPLTLPAAKRIEATVATPAPLAHKSAEALPQRADLPPTEGFTLLVDGHFKNRFNDLKGAKAAASELKSRFPMLRVEIYDATKKIRLPA